MQFESLSKPSCSQRVLTNVVTDNWQVNLFQDDLVLPCRAKLVLSPSGGKTGASIKSFIRLWQADTVKVHIKVKIGFQE